MMFNEVKSGEIPCLRFLKSTNYAMYVGPELTPKQRELLKSKDIPMHVNYLPEILEQQSDGVVKYNFPEVTIPVAPSSATYTSWSRILTSFQPLPVTSKAAVRLPVTVQSTST